MVRPGTGDDIGAVTDIYAHAVRHGSSSFEIVAPDIAEMARRRAEVIGRGLPWLVAQAGNDVVGYAYATPFRARAAYRFTLEDSIYLHPRAQRAGIGRVLLAELLARCEQTGARQMVAVIGDSNSLASIALHRRLGFAHSGTLKAVGWKFGRWIDVVLMQRALGPGAGAVPPGGIG